MKIIYSRFRNIQNTKPADIKNKSVYLIQAIYENLRQVDNKLESYLKTNSNRNTNIKESTP